MGAFPLDRSRPDSPTVRIMLDRLKRGRVVAMFPEGAIRGPEESVLAGGKVNPRVGRLARMASVPLIPCVIVGTGAYRRPVNWLPLRRVRFGLNYGQPIEFAREGPEPDWASFEAELRCVYQQLHAELAAAMDEREDS
jgi:1-acyl-sn-glycerol-3-phosphate acyltransferase